MSLEDQLKDVLAQTKTLAAKAQQEKRDFNDEENAQILDLKKKADKLKEKIKKADEAQAAFKALTGPTEERKASSPVEQKTQPVAKSYGEAFTRSKPYQSMKDSHPNATSIHFEVARIRVKTDPAPLTSDLPGAVIPYMMPGYTDVTYPQTNTLLSLITRSTTENKLIEYRQLIDVTSNASTVPEGGRRPLSTLSTGIAEAKAYTVADGMKVTYDELFDDGVIGSMINTVLMRNIAGAEEDLVLHGDGNNNGPSIGLLTDPNIQKVPFEKDAVTTISHALTQLRNTIRTISIQAIVLNPTDDENFNLMADKNGRYLSNAPFGVGPSTLFGYPRITSSMLPQGTALIGDFHSVLLLDYEPLSILAFNQNSDDAEHNLAYVRAQKREVLMLMEPKKIALASIAGSAPASK